MLVEQLDMFETGQLSLTTAGEDVGPAASERLKREIMAFDDLISEDEALRRGGKPASIIGSGPFDFTSYWLQTAYITRWSSMRFALAGGPERAYVRPEESTRIIDIEHKTMVRENEYLKLRCAQLQRDVGDLRSELLRAQQQLERVHAFAADGRPRPPAGGR